MNNTEDANSKATMEVSGGDGSVGGASSRFLKPLKDRASSGGEDDSKTSHPLHSRQCRESDDGSSLGARSGQVSESTGHGAALEAVHGRQREGSFLLKTMRVCGCSVEIKTNLEKMEVRIRNIYCSPMGVA